MVHERYYKLQVRRSKKQFEIIMRLRDDVLEEMTGFMPLSIDDDSMVGVYYEARINTSGNRRSVGDLAGREGIVGLLLSGNNTLEIDYSGKEAEISVSKVSMSRAAETMESKDYRKKMKAFFS